MKKLSHMEERLADFGLNINQVRAFSVRGVWDHDSSAHLNIHSSHQVLTAQDGMILLEDNHEKQPLYRHMAAFIPAGTPHRAFVMREGKKVICDSIFINMNMFSGGSGNIQIFDISELGSALLRKLNERNYVDLSGGLMEQCLGLFISVLQEDIRNTSRLIRLPEAKHRRNKLIIEFIKTNYMNKIRLEHLTHVVPLSVRHISRLFQADLKVPLFEYLRLYRLLQASVHLHEKNRKVIDIAFDCGYDSTSSFYEDFKHYFGLSPNRFRKKILGQDRLTQPSSGLS